MLILLLAGVAVVAAMAMSRGGGRTLADWVALDQANSLALIGDPDRKAAWEAAARSVINTLRREGGPNLVPALMSVRRLDVISAWPIFLVTFRLIDVEGVTSWDVPLQAVGDVEFTVQAGHPSFEITREDWPPGLQPGGLRPTLLPGGPAPLF